MTAKIIPFPSSQIENGRPFQFSLSLIRDEAGDITFAASCEVPLYKCEGLRDALGDLVAMIDNKVDFAALPNGQQWTFERIDSDQGDRP